MKKTTLTVLMVLLFCSSGLAASRTRAVQLPFGLSWRDNDEAVRNKLKAQGFQEMSGQQFDITVREFLALENLDTGFQKASEMREERLNKDREKKKGKETQYYGTAMEASAVVEVKFRKGGIESVQINFSRNPALEGSLPHEVQNMPKTLGAELGEPYTGTDSNVWSRVLPRRLVGNNVWYLPQTRHLVWMATLSSYDMVLMYAYVEKSFMYYYFLGFILALAGAWGLRKVFSRSTDYLGYAGDDDEPEE